MSGTQYVRRYYHFSYDFLIEVLFVTIYLKFLTVDEHGSVIYLTMGMLFAFQF